MSDYHVEFCDSKANRTISADPYAEDDADEIRLWSADSTLIVAVEKNERSRMWHVSGSDGYNWTRTTKTRPAFGAWRDAMAHLDGEIADFIKSAGY